VPYDIQELGRVQQGVESTDHRMAVIKEMIARSPALATMPEQMA
jgi:hypothetical protein